MHPDLLVGLLAVRNGLVTEAELKDALEVLQADEQNVPLSDVLEQTGRITAVERRLLDELVAWHLDTNKDKASPFLQTLPIPASLRDSIAKCKHLATEQSLPLFADESIQGSANNVSLTSDSVKHLQLDSRFLKEKPHAEGGLGIVSIAEDTQLARQVALKEIRQQYSNDEECRRRFVLEAQVTGALEHPGIIPVYGLGVNKEGYPYYAMRFIRGESMQQAIVRIHSPQNSETREREIRRLLQRFLAVCNTIEYAHSEGVLHRDIKPDNIMLGPYGETLVLDWGLAKVTDAKTDSPSEQGCVLQSAAPDAGNGSTRMGAAMGTPGFMSPEQSLGWHDKLTPASDVYSLGCVLFCVATGSRPFDSNDIATIIRKTQTGEFPSPRAKNTAVAKPLEAIILRAMATKANQRYQSAKLLADDVEAFLADEPVTAWEEPLSVKTRRWVKRHRTFVATAISGCGITIVGLVIGIVLLSAANRRETLARESAEDARDQSTRISQLAMDRYGDYVKAITSSPRLKAANLEPLRRDLLFSAKDFYNELANITGESDRLRSEQAEAFFQLGNLEDELEQRAEAIGNYSRGIERLRELQQDPSSASDDNLIDIIRFTANIALNQRILGKNDEANQTLDEAEELATNLRSAKPSDEKVQEAVAYQLASIHHNRGSWLFSIGEYLKAESSYMKSQELLAPLTSRSTNGNAKILRLSASTNSNLGSVYFSLNRFDDAKELLQETIQTRTNLFAEDGDDAYHQNEIARTQKQLGDIAFRQADFNTARTEFDNAQTTYRSLVAAHPEVSKFQHDLALLNTSQAVLFARLGMHDDSLSASAAAIETWQRLIQTNPNRDDYLSKLSTVYFNRAELLISLQRINEAVQPAEESWRICEQRLANHPDSNTLKADVAETLIQRARIDQALGNLQDALEKLQQARTTLEALAESHSEISAYRITLGHCWSSIASLLSVLDPDNSTSAYRSALAVRQQITAEFPDLAHCLFDMLVSQSNLARHYASDGLYQEALTEFAECLVGTKAVLESHPEHDQAQRLYSTTLAAQGTALSATGQFQAAVDSFDAAYQQNAPPYPEERLSFATSLAFSDQVERAQEIVAEIEKDLPNHAQVISEYAVACAALSTKLWTLNEQEADLPNSFEARAVDSIDRLVAAGYFHIEANRTRFKHAWSNGIFGNSKGFADRRSLMTEAEE
ncbi:MAG: protein kinase [Planctomycetales bacterium]|nr:protein kinase [Planctomycetales bacterium]